MRPLSVSEETFNKILKLSIEKNTSISNITETFVNYGFNNLEKENFQFKVKKRIPKETPKK